MPQMTDVTSVAANATSLNLLSGKNAEFIQRPSTIFVAVVASAVGLFLTLLITEQTIVDDQEVSGANRFPTIDDVSVDHGAVPGDRLTLKLRNSTGAAITGNSLVKVVPVG